MSVDALFAWPEPLKWHKFEELDISMAKLTLQEQMLKAGLVNEKKLKKAKKGSKKSRVQAREVKAAVEENKRAQLERDKELSLQQKEQRLSKEISAQIKQLVEMNKIDIADGDIKYNFTDGTLVKSLYVTSLIRDQLIKGIVAIARYEETYAVIPSGVANKIAMRDDNTVIEQKALEADIPAEDDPYADFVVPDDLMW
ncbi:DUF2058 domain-containing protein [Vibrio diazotrophicus]|jgi:uncharacterized protein YaiL (DUF2058 family)